MRELNDPSAYNNLNEPEILNFRVFFKNQEILLQISFGIN